MATTAERLQKVRDAIDTLVGTGASVRLGDRQVTRADLTELRNLEKDLMAQLASETSAAAGRGRSRLYYVTPR